MIGRIKGVLLEKQMPYLLVDVNGIGYELQVSTHSFYRLPNVGADVTLHTHLAIREDAHVLYGFATPQERSLFRYLIKVSGIGPKSALVILSSAEPAEFVRCVIDDDISGLVRLPGIGKKTAQRLLIEMRDKLTNWEFEGLGAVSGATVESGASQPSAIKDAVSALVALGYNPQDARRVILQHRPAGLSSEELIRLALKELGG